MKRQIFLCQSLLAAAILSSAAQAQTSSTWTATTAGAYNWFDAGNWSANGVPDASTERAAFNQAGFGLSGVYDVTIGSDLTLGRITFDSVNPTAATVNLLGAGTITLNDSTGTNQATIQRNANSPLGFINNNIILDDANGVTLNGNFRINGAISGNSTLSKAGTANTYIGAGNTFSGNVSLNGGALIATAANAYSSATGGTYTFAGTASGGFGTDAFATTTFNNAIVLAGAGTSGNAFYVGRDAGSILDITTSSITDQGTSANGAVSIARVTADNPYSVGATGTGTGTVKFSGTGFTVNRNVTGGANTAIMELANTSGTQTWSGNFTGFTGSSAIVKSGAGTAIIGQASAAHTYTSQTRVDAGTLILNGTFTQASALNASGLGSGSTGRFQVESGGILQVDGRINVQHATNSTSNNAVLIKSGGTLAPGANGIGTIVLDAASFVRSGGNDRILNMATGSFFAYEIAANGGSADRIDFWSYQSGDLLLNDNTLNVTLTGPLIEGTYTVDLFRFFSDGGTTATASGISSGLVLGVQPDDISAWSLIYNTNAIQLQYTIDVIPEPRAALLGSLGLLALLRRRRQSC